ncbi:MAG: HEAT repeat domain-containing protein [Algisphaera sp.]
MPFFISTRPIALALLLLTTVATLPACQIGHKAPSASSSPAPTLSSIAKQRDRAIAIVRNIAHHDNPQLRMRAIETVQHLDSRTALPLIQEALNDDHPAVRYAALVTVGKTPLPWLADAALAHAHDTQQPDYVRAAGTFAAHKTAPSPDRPIDLTPLTTLLWSKASGMRANAAVLLGDSGEVAAKPMLRDAALNPPARTAALDQELLDLQIREALAKLGDEEQIKKIRLACYSNFDEVRVLAVLMLGRLNDHSLSGNFIGFLAKDPMELRLAAAQSLAELGNPEGLPVAQLAARSQHPSIRSQAALTLGRIAHASPQNNTIQPALGRLLNDSDPGVRLAAASAVLDRD